jgi:hypothetical protein
MMRSLPWFYFSAEECKPIVKSKGLKRHKAIQYIRGDLTEAKLSYRKRET